MFILYTVCFSGGNATRNRTSSFFFVWFSQFFSILEQPRHILVCDPKSTVVDKYIEVLITVIRSMIVFEIGYSYYTNIVDLLLCHCYYVVHF